MVDISDYVRREDEEPDDGGGDGGDLAALKTCLRALADALASTNLAVLSGAQGDMAAATTRIQASVTALTRFHQAFAVLDADPGAEADADADED